CPATRAPSPGAAGRPRSPTTRTGAPAEPAAKTAAGPPPERDPGAAPPPGVPAPRPPPSILESSAGLGPPTGTGPRAGSGRYRQDQRPLQGAPQRPRRRSAERRKNRVSPAEPLVAAAVRSGTGRDGGNAETSGDERPRGRQPPGSAPGPAAGSGAPSGASAGPAGPASGTRTVNAAPPPGACAADAPPPCSSAMLRTIARPSPLPPVRRLRDLSARQNRPKTCGRSSAEIPVPVSATSISASAPSRRPRTVTVPPSGVCRIALPTRFPTACSSRARSAIGTTPGPASATRRTPAVSAVSARSEERRG